MTIHLIKGKVVFGKIRLSKNCCFSCKHSQLIFAVIDDNSIRAFKKHDRMKEINGKMSLVSMCTKRQFFCPVNSIERCSKGFDGDFLQCRKGCWEEM